MEKSTQRPITVARLRSKPTRDGRARRVRGISVIVRGPGARPIQGRSMRGSTLAAPDLPRALLTHIAPRDARPPDELRGGPSGSPSAHCRGGARVHGHDNQAEPLPPPRSRPRTRHRLRLAGAVPFPLFGRRECRAPVNCGSAIDVGDWTGPERGASPEARCRAAYTKHDLLRRGPCGGQRVGLQLVESSTTGPKRLPLPCRSPPVVRARRHPRKRNSRKECRSRACPCKSGTGLEEYPPRARFLRLRRSLGR